MAITLRQVKGSELTYPEMDTNLQSFYYSSSFDSNTTIVLYTTGSTSHSIDLSTLAVDIETGSFFTGAGLVSETLTLTRADGTTQALDFSDFVIDVESGSFYVSSSYNGSNAITFYQGDGSSETVTLSGLSSTNIYNSDGTLSGTREINHDGNILRFNAVNSGRFIISGSTNVYIDGLGSSTQPNVVGIDTNGKLYVQSTGSFSGGSTSPASPSTSVQFNNGGSFGGSSNLTWDNTNRRLTVVREAAISADASADTARLYINASVNNTNISSSKAEIRYTTFDTGSAESTYGIISHNTADTIGGTPYEIPIVESDDQFAGSRTLYVAANDGASITGDVTAAFLANGTVAYTTGSKVTVGSGLQITDIAVAVTGNTVYMRITMNENATVSTMTTALGRGLA